MSIVHNQKKSTMAQYQKHKTDTGSAIVQIALITDRINYLQSHLNIHKKDHSSRRGLLSLVGRRRKLLNYIKLNDKNNYQKAMDVIKGHKAKNPQ